MVQTMRSGQKDRRSLPLYSIASPDAPAQRNKYDIAIPQM